MMEYKCGYLAKSLAGHDKDRVYMIMKEEGEYVFLSDGKIRAIDKPKKKKKKHIQVICKEHDTADISDADIRKIVREFS